MRQISNKTIMALGLIIAFMSVSFAQVPDELLEQARQNQQLSSGTANITQAGVQQSAEFRLTDYLFAKYIGKIITVYKKDGNILTRGYPMRTFIEKQSVFMELYNTTHRSKSTVKLEIVGILNGLYRNQLPEKYRGAAEKGKILGLEAEEELNTMIGPLLTGGSSVSSGGINASSKVSQYPINKAVSKTTEKINVYNLAKKTYIPLQLILKGNQICTEEGDPVTIIFKEA